MAGRPLIALAWAMLAAAVGGLAVAGIPSVVPAL